MVVFAVVFAVMISLLLFYQRGLIYIITCEIFAQRLQQEWLCQQLSSPQKEITRAQAAEAETYAIATAAAAVAVAEADEESKAPPTSDRRKSLPVSYRETEAMQREAALQRRENLKQVELERYGETFESKQLKTAAEPEKKYKFLKPSDVRAPKEQADVNIEAKTSPYMRAQLEEQALEEQRLEQRETQEAPQQMQTLASQAPIMPAMPVSPLQPLLQGPEDKPAEKMPVKVVVRKRPAKEGEADCVRCEASTVICTENKQKVLNAYVARLFISSVLLKNTVISPLCFFSAVTKSRFSGGFDQVLARTQVRIRLFLRRVRQHA